MNKEDKDPSEKIVLDYHDSLLRKSDVDLLKGPIWINDNIIGFYFEFLGNQEIAKTSDILYVSPYLTQLLKFINSSQVPDFLAPLNALDKKFIFFPLNDCGSIDNAGGTHWSLLICSKVENTFFHFDSSQGFNNLNARDLTNKLMSFFFEKKKGKLVEAECPQQTNSYDCGLYVIILADILTENILKNCKIQGVNLESVTQFKVSDKRRILLDLIKSLGGHY